MLINKLGSINSFMGNFCKASCAAAALFIAGCENQPIKQKELHDLDHNHHHGATEHTDHVQSENNHTKDSSHHHNMLDPNFNSSKVDQAIAEIRGKLFQGQLLEKIDLLDRAYYKDGFHSGKSQIIEGLAHERLESEVFTLAWEELFLENPDQVIVGEYTNVNDFELSDDQGRGLRLILRKKVGWFNISTIIFLDYNPKTKKLEFPESHFYKSSTNTIPDAMRVLVDIYEDIPKERFKTFQDTGFVEFQEAGIIGASIDAEIDINNTKVIALNLLPHGDEFGHPVLDTNNKSIDGLIDTFSCSACHGQGYGFIDSAGSSGFATKQRSLHLHQEEATHDFLLVISNTKDFASEAEKQEVLKKIRIQLENPKKYLQDLLPTGLTDAMKKKQKELTRKSTVYTEYQFERQKIRDAKHFELALDLINERLISRGTSPYDLEVALECANLKASIEKQAFVLKKGSKLKETNEWLDTTYSRLKSIEDNINRITKLAEIAGHHAFLKDLDEVPGNLTTEEIKVKLSRLILDRATRVNNNVNKWQREYLSNDEIKDAVSKLATYETTIFQFMMQFPENERFRHDKHVINHFTEDAIEHAERRSIDWRSIYEESSKNALQL